VHDDSVRVVGERTIAHAGCTTLPRDTSWCRAAGSRGVERITRILLFSARAEARPLHRLPRPTRWMNESRSRGRRDSGTRPEILAAGGTRDDAADDDTPYRIETALGTPARLESSCVHAVATRRNTAYLVGNRNQHLHVTSAAQACPDCVYFLQSEVNGRFDILRHLKSARRSVSGWST
jgi:hypothetical protein